MWKTLLLDKDYSPVSFLNEREAIRLLYLGKAEIVVTDAGPSEWPEKYDLACGKQFPISATLRLPNVSVRYRRRRNYYSRTVVFNRDNWTCQYCGQKVLPREATIDHVIPVSRGGKTSWLNCVTACHKCNRKKSNKMLDDVGMVLLSSPQFPRLIDFWDIKRLGQWHTDWNLFLDR